MSKYISFSTSGSLQLLNTLSLLILVIHLVFLFFSKFHGNFGMMKGSGYMWYWFIGLRQLKYYWKQTVICVLGIAVAIMVLMVILSFIQGINEFFGERILLLTPHLTIEAGIHDFITTDHLTDIKAVDGVQAVAPYVTFPGILQKSLSAEPVAVKAVDWDQEDQLLGIRHLLEAGDWEQIKTNTGIVLGAELARILGVRVGDVVTLATAAHSVPLAVDGLFYTGYHNADSQVVLMPLTLGQNISAAKGITGYGVTVDDLNAVDDYLLPLQEATGHWVRPWYSNEQGLFISMAVQRTVLVWILLFTLFVSSLGIMNVFLLRAWSQQKTVGMLRALGATSRQVGALFLIQGLISGVIGGACGLILARITVSILGRMTIHLPQVYYMERLPIMWAAQDWPIVLVAAILTGLLAVLWPAWRMMRLNPVDAIRKL